MYQKSLEICDECMLLYLCSPKEIQIFGAFPIVDRQLRRSHGFTDHEADTLAIIPIGVTLRPYPLQPVKVTWISPCTSTEPSMLGRPCEMTFV